MYSTLLYNKLKLLKMKKFKILSIAILSVILFNCNGKTQVKEKSNEIIANKIEVIDFHSTHRCMTCNAIEQNTKFTLEKYFSKELENESITFLVINVDEEENFNMAEKFEATGTSLFLNVISDGKESKIDLTNFAFMKGNDKDVFSEELKAKIEEELKKI